MKIVTVIGARPQFIKAAMVSKQFSMHDRINEVIIHTGQHFDSNMSNIFFKEMQIPQPSFNLGINNLSHGAMTGRQLESIEKILFEEKPDFLLVYGDTNSTLSGALAASKLHIPVAHVEAGLRSFNQKMPEEINRILTDHISDKLYAPTTVAQENLIREGIISHKINVVGDVMFDAVLFYYNSAERKSNILFDINILPKEYILTTIHRAENTDKPDRLKDIFSALSHTPYPIVLPLHPRTKKKLELYEIDIDDNIIVIDPVGYLDMLILEKNAYKIVTDSGGIQKEAYFFGVPCITLRDETEWIELEKIGANHLVGSDKNLIINAINSKDHQINKIHLYGDGDAAKKIANSLYS